MVSSMTQYIVELSEAENLALSHISYSQQDWINNAVHERCRIAIDEIVTITIEKCFSENIQVPSSKEETVKLAFKKGWIKSAEQNHAEDPGPKLQTT